MIINVTVDDQTKNHFHSCLRTYGLDMQESVATEEAAEFIRTVSRLKRSRMGYSREPISSAIENVTEEIADTLIMMMQLCQFYGITEKQLSSMVTDKLMRQMRRINKASDDDNSNWLICSEILPENETLVNVLCKPQGGKHMTCQAIYEDGLLPKSESKFVWNDSNCLPDDDEPDKMLVKEGWYRCIDDGTFVSPLNMAVTAWSY